MQHEKECRQALDAIISSLSKQKKTPNGICKRSRILLVSETNNACLSLSSSDEELEEGSEPDLHQCGHCKLMFNNLAKYITHKLQKTCWTGSIPVADEPTWSPVQNGSSSPDDISAKEDEEAVASNIEVRNLNYGLQKRKHRKGLVRRLKPPDNIEENESIDALEQVFDDEGTVFIGDPQQTDKLVNELSKKEISDKNSSQIIVSSASNTEPGLTIKRVESCGKKYYKQTFYTENHGKDQIDINPNSTYSSSSPNIKHIPEEDNPQKVFSAQFYSHPSNRISKFDRVPSKLPHVMSTHGSTSSLENTDRPYSMITYDRYYPYDVDTTSTWTSNYRTDKTNKYNVYTPSYDKYQTMITLEQDEPPSFIGRAESKQDKSSKYPNVDLKMRSVHENSNESNVVSTNEPPELVRITTSEDDTGIGTQSPPALEKCHTPVFLEPKVEEEVNQDSNLEPTDPVIREDKQENNQEDGVTSSKFQDMSSPEKDINSPHDSTHSHDTEDFTSEQSTRDSYEVRLPRHRQLSESTIERLITEPCNQSGDASWKHAKQVYRCPLCAKIFPFKSKLQRHVLVHTGIKPYKCTVCGRGFTQQIDLQRHLTRHTGEKPFKCHLCKAQFIRADNLRKHCKDAHYVNIEEPIRKRRRKTTGSDTVLPPLEVAIALALSETERNGGRVLGRAVTRSHTKTTTTKTKADQRRAEDNPTRYSLPARTELKGYQTFAPQVPQQPDLRYPFQHGMESNAPSHHARSPKHAGMQQRSGSPNERSRSPHRDRRMYPPPPPPPAADSRFYHHHPPPTDMRYYSRSGYERDANDIYIQEMDRARRPAADQHPHRFLDIDPRYQTPNYISMAREQPSVAYRRGAKHVTPRMQSDYEYTVSHAPSIHKRLDETDRRQSNPSRETDVVLPRSEASDEVSFRKNDVYYSGRYSESSRHTGQHNRYADGKLVYQSRAPETIVVRESEHRGDYHEMYDAYQRDRNKIEPDPGEYISMATTKGNDEIESAVMVTNQERKSEGEQNVYVDEQEIPIVTPSDDVSMM